MANEVLKTLYDPNFDVNTLSELYVINDEDTFQSDDDRKAIRKILDGFYRDWEQKQYMAIKELDTLMELEEIFLDKDVYLTTNNLLEYIETCKFPYAKNTKPISIDELNEYINNTQNHIEEDEIEDMEYAI